MKTQWVRNVAEFVDSDDTNALTSVTDGAQRSVREVYVVLADGTRVAVAEHGRDLVEFMLRSLYEGRVVHVDAEDELLSPGRAAELLEVTRPTVYRWQDAGLLPVVMKGRVRAVPAEAALELKAVRDSREATEVLAERARELNADRPEGQGGADGRASARELFGAVQKAVRAGSPGDAASAWRVHRATAVAGQARNAREKLVETPER